MKQFYLESDDGTFFANGDFGSDEPEVFNTVAQLRTASYAAVKKHPHPFNLREQESLKEDIE